MWVGRCYADTQAGVWHCVYFVGAHQAHEALTERLARRISDAEHAHCESDAAQSEKLAALAADNAALRAKVDEVVADNVALRGELAELRVTVRELTTNHASFRSKSDHSGSIRSVISEQSPGSPSRATSATASAPAMISVASPPLTEFAALAPKAVSVAPAPLVTPAGSGPRTCFGFFKRMRACGVGFFRERGSHVRNCLLPLWRAPLHSRAC